MIVISSLAPRHQGLVLVQVVYLIRLIGNGLDSPRLRLLELFGGFGSFVVVLYVALAGTGLNCIVLLPSRYVLAEGPDEV